MHEAASIDLGRLAQDLQLKRKQVENVVQLLDEDNTVPFITRYRKEQTGGLDEEQIRAVQHRVGQLRQLAERRQTILRTIEAQGKLTEELQAAIQGANTSKRLEDLYLPYKPKKQTLATIARERGLGNLAEAIWSQDEAVRNLDEILPGMLDPEKQLNTVEDVLTGVQHVLAEKIAEDAEVRDAVRKMVFSGRIVTVKAASESDSPGPLFPAEGKGQEILAEFRNYFDFSEPVRQIPPHRVLAINRGESLGVLKVRIEIQRDKLNEILAEKLRLAEHAHRDFLLRCVNDALDRLVLRSIERETRGELTENAERHAIDVFARNLRHLLLQPPVPNRRVLAIDPGFRTGCKYAVLDEIGNLLNQGVIYPHVKRKKKKKKAKAEKAPVPVVATDTGVLSPEVVASFEAVAEEVGAATKPKDATAEAEPTQEPPTHSASEEPPVLPADSFPRSIPPGDEIPEGGKESHEAADPDGSDPAPPSLSELAATNPAYEMMEGGEDGPPKSTDANAEPIAESAELTGETEPSPAEPVADAASSDKAEVTAEESATASPAGVVEKPAKPKAPAEPQLSKRDKAKKMIAELCRLHNIGVIAIGNGTACRETEEMVSETLREEALGVQYCIVNEAGASVYSASPVGREEFPNYDATLRGTISIGRRLQDPLSELVKIDPQNIGVGLYQHDINPRLLKETLSEVVESCVNYVGVDLNTASVPLLQHVSGLNQLRARNIVDHRSTNGPFRNRQQLLDVAGIGPAVFTQAAGFLKISGGDQPLDRTWIHPESYPVALRVLEGLGYDPEVLNNRAEVEHLHAKLAGLNVEELSAQLETGVLTIQDILDNIVRPGRDPREDLPKPIFKTGVLRLEDLSDGMQLQGTVLNVVDFGVFVDIGLKDSGLVHISQLANRYIRSPHDIVAVGDVVTVWVLAVDHERRRVSLTMIEPGTERPVSPPPRRRARQGETAPQGRAPQTAEAGSVQEGAAVGGQQGGNRDRRQYGGQQGQRGGGGRGQGHGRGQGRGHHGHGRQQGGGQAQPARHREKKRPKPVVQLSQEALEGKAVLHTFGELKALFEHKKKPGGKGDKEESK